MRKSNSYVRLANDLTIQAGYIEIHATAVYLSGSGRLIIALGEFPGYSQMYALLKELSKWKFDDVDRIACNYTWSVRGQTYHIADLMAEAGYMDFDESVEFAAVVEKHLAAKNCTLVYPGPAE